MEKLIRRVGGWQCWVDIYNDYVIKTIKTREEVSEAVRRHLEPQGKFCHPLPVPQLL